jgi:hypothetical protein
MTRCFPSRVALVAALVLLAADSLPASPPSAAPPASDTTPTAPVSEAPPAPPADLPPPPTLPDDDRSFGIAKLLGIPGFGGPPVPQASYRFTWLPDQNVVNQPTYLGFIRQDLNVSSPLWHDGGDTWTVSANVRGETFFTHAVLPNPPQAFPSELWAVNFGTQYGHTFANGWTAGGGINLGSASDELFHSTREMTLGANGFLVIPQGEHNAWLFTLVYSPTGELAFPVPGVAYLWQPSDELRVNFGLPFAVTYRPTDRLTFDFSYMLVRTVHARATYRFAPQLAVFAGYDWNSESYYLADREDPRERLFYYDMRASAGVQAKLGQHLSLELTGGYEFDRFYFEGVSWTDRNNDRIDVNPGPFIALQGRVRW